MIIRASSSCQVDSKSMSGYIISVAKGIQTYSLHVKMSFSDFTSI